MAERIRNFDWSRTPIGPIVEWPEALTVLVNNLLGTRLPMILMWGAELTHLYNDAVIPILDAARHPAALGERGEVVWREAWPISGPQIEAALHGEACWNEDQHVPIYRDGQLQDTWFTYSYSPARDAEGAIQGVLISFLDTSSRVGAARALQLERQRLLAAFQQAPAFFALLKGPEHVFELVNPMYLRLIGGRDVAGKPIGKALPEIVEQGYVDLLDRVFSTGEPFVGQGLRFTLEETDGLPREERYVDFVYQPLREADGSVSGILVFGVDLTHRIHSDTALKEQRDRFEFATDAAQIGYWFCDLPFDQLSWDVRVKEHFWLPPDAKVDIRLFYELLHPEDRERTREAIETSIARHTAYDIEYRSMAPDGRCKWIHAFGRTAYDADGGPLRFDGVTQDITQLKQTQGARQRAEEALIRAEKLALVGRLAATISHEINNPLESVTNLLYLLEQEATGDAAKMYCQTAQAELARVSHIVTHTLRFNRQGNVAGEESLSELLDSALAIYEARLRHSGITLRRDYRDAPRVCCFGAELRQVFANLIGNAFDATRGPGSLVLRTRRQNHGRTAEPGVRITIADTGHGIPPATKARLFEPFFTTKGDSGTGLGLWVSREILNKHHASIRLHSCTQPGRSGTVFSIWIPQASAGDPSAPAA
ncbi:MAG TPA: ATP-binding protein [Acidobacteriaceae bacterium]|jgi:PAS domain S-box-containing protein|nr:ATP-binding protein [Acidobacteriaceae bacterium]